MSGFEAFVYHNGELFVENVSLKKIAEKFGTPCYIYSQSALTNAYQQFDAAFEDRDHLICYAVKANSNLAILNLLARLGSGFDIVSGGELQRVIRAGGDAQKTIFSGVGKSVNEMRMALNLNILCFNVESEAELITLNHVAQNMNKVAPVSLRVNPDVDAKTHPYISTGLKENKFGIAVDEAMRIYQSVHLYPYIRFTGIDCHIGSQLSLIEPFVEASEKMLQLFDGLKKQKLDIEHIDLGGGLGIRYNNEKPPSIKEYISKLCSITRNIKQRLVIEPGRALVGNSGILLTRIEYLKQTPARNFAIVDAAMNDLIRPSLYDAYHEILPVEKSTIEAKNYEIVGPICETGDFLGHDRKLSITDGDLLAIMSAGAYGMSMSSNYNTRPRAAEILVVGSQTHVIRQRESIEQIIAGEQIIAY
ncbi:MAG: diaminopimelate decarboxylase [Nitrosomonas sp.]|nr:diaminopimelate decarboxylase [Nitrosomonas sp.]